MWANVRDNGNYNAITTASFNYGYQNHGGGWYWVNSPANSWLYCTATDYNDVNKWTDGLSEVYLYMTKRK